MNGGIAMIRQAKAEDAAQVAPLIYIILEDMELPFLEGVSKEMMLEMIEASFLRPDYRFSMENVMVKEIDGQVAGLLVSYHGEHAENMDDEWDGIQDMFGIVKKMPLFTEQETWMGEYYLDSLVVDSAYRGQGIGKELLHAFKELAVAKNCEIIALNVEKANEGALNLYKKLGYESEYDLVLSGHDYYHMTQNVRS